jgi:hypothetical protein
MELPAEVITEIQANRKVSAIKLLRKQQNIGLKEAKDIVDAYTDKHPSNSPSRVPESVGGVGRLLFFAVVVGAVYGLYRYFYLKHVSLCGHALTRAGSTLPSGTGRAYSARSATRVRNQ